MPVSTTRTNRKSRSAQSHRGRTKRQTAHVVIDQSPPARRRPRARSVARARATKNPRSGAHEYVVLPSWKELDKATNGRVVAPRSHPFDSISTARIALLILGVAVAVTAYVGHVHATQNVLSNVENLRFERARLRLEYNSVKGEYDRITGPAEIRPAARELGLVETTVFGETIAVDR